MKILLISDDCYHPGWVPEQGLSSLKEEGFELDVLRDTTGLLLNTLIPYEVIVLAKGNKTSAVNSSPWEDGPAEEAFLQYVERGGGVLFIHAGAAVKNGADGMCRLMGHRFFHHPEQCAVTITPLKPHPITQGVESFTVYDEHYFIKIQIEDTDILMVSTSQHGTQVAGYTRTMGRGRVCNLMPGHNIEVWNTPSYRKTIANAIQWCKGEL